VRGGVAAWLSSVIFRFLLVIHLQIFYQILGLIDNLLAAITGLGYLFTRFELWYTFITRNDVSCTPTLFQML
jgi:hypothetical protein